MSKRTCIVTFDDGTPCERERKFRNGWCMNCYLWSWRRGGADPNGRRSKRRNGEVIAALQEAAKATGPACFILDGYSLRPNVKWNETWMNASRAVWIIANGDPGDASVLHRCGGGSGTNGCISIAHLYLGDSEQNAADKVKSGRHRYGVQDGEDNGRAVLTEEDVREIRRVYVPYSRRHEPTSAIALAAKYGVCDQTIRWAARGKSWKGVYS